MWLAAFTTLVRKYDAEEKVKQELETENIEN